MYEIPVFLWTIIFYIKAWLGCIEVCEGVECLGRVILISKSKHSISIGRSVIILSDSRRCTASSIYSSCKIQTHSPAAKIVIEDNVGLNGVSIVARSKTIRIGRGSMIAPSCTIVDSDFHAMWPAEGRLTNPGFENDQDVNIGKNVWLGMQVIVLKGVTIGDGAVIGAGSVVTHDIPPNCLAAGVPAKVFKQLP